MLARLSERGTRRAARVVVALVSAVATFALLLAVFDTKDPREEAQQQMIDQSANRVSGPS
ncbi:MAG: hypothetical protein NVS3B20_25220 [Polyangiales bacterium]